MKIFITGGTGFIGQRIVDILLEKGHELVCLTHQKKLDHPNITSVQGDLLKKETLVAMKGADAVLANAAIYTYGPTRYIKKIMRDVNVIGTKNTLDVALELGIPKIVYTSSIAVFGDTTPYGVASEDDIAKYTSPCYSLYTQTKRDAHIYAQQLIDQKNAPIIMPMPSCVYGPDDHSMIGDFMTDLVRGTMKGQIDLKIKYNYNFVDDVAKGIVLCLEKGKPGPYLIAGPESHNINPTDFWIKAAEIGGLPIPQRKVSLKTVAMIEKLYRIKGAIFDQYQPINAELIKAFQLNFEFTNSKAVRELGYTTISLTEGIKRTVEWYKQKYGIK